MSEVRDDPPAPAVANASHDSPGRRRRGVVLFALLLGLALLVVAGVGKWLYERRATHRAAVAAANMEVLEYVDERYEAIEEAARDCLEAATRLGTTLQHHLVVSQPERSDAELTADRQHQQTALASAGRQLLNVAEAPPPELPPLADAPLLGPHLERLAGIERTAKGHARQLMTLAAASELWGAAVTNLRAEAQHYVDVADADRNVQGDPAALRAQWQRERAVLERYRAAALAAREVPGLAAYADAFLGYIDGSRGFIDEATILLAQGQIERYNQRLQEVFGVEDPFGFNSALATATGEALDSGLILNLTQARNATTTLMDEIAVARNGLGPLMASRPLAR